MFAKLVGEDQPDPAKGDERSEQALQAEALLSLAHRQPEGEERRQGQQHARGIGRCLTKARVEKRIERGERHHAIGQGAHQAPPHREAAPRGQHDQRQDQSRGQESNRRAPEGRQLLDRLTHGDGIRPAEEHHAGESGDGRLAWPPRNPRLGCHRPTISSRAVVWPQEDAGILLKTRHNFGGDS